MILNKEEKKCLIDSLTWMIEDMKHRHDDIKDNLEKGSQGDYSVELKTAMLLLDTIKKTETVETTEYHRKSALLNCQEFDCLKSQQGICNSPKVTLESTGSLILGHLKCVEAEAEEKEEE